MITMEPLDTAIGTLAEQAEKDAPGEGADAVIWDELAARTGEDSTLTWTFVAFMVLATLLASIGVVTDSPITIVGAMVVGPEFGPLAGIAVGILRRRRHGASGVRWSPSSSVSRWRWSSCGLLALLAKAIGLIAAHDITGGGRQTEYIYHPGWFSLITALVAGHGRDAVVDLEQVGGARRGVHLRDDDPRRRQRRRGRRARAMARDLAVVGPARHQSRRHRGAGLATLACCAASCRRARAGRSRVRTAA